MDFLLGSIHMGGEVLLDSRFSKSPALMSLLSRLFPTRALAFLADQSITWWAIGTWRFATENRGTLRGGGIQISDLTNNREARERLIDRGPHTLQPIDDVPPTQTLRRAPIYPRGEVRRTVMGVACGTCRGSSEPGNSVEKLEGRFDEQANLRIAMASALPFCPSAPLGLTVTANVLRIGAALRAAQ